MQILDVCTLSKRTEVYFNRESGSSFKSGESTRNIAERYKKKKLKKEEAAAAAAIC